MENTGLVHEYRPETMVQDIGDDRVSIGLKVQAYSLGEKHDLIRSWILEVHNIYKGAHVDIQVTSNSIDELIEYLKRVKVYYENKPDQQYF